MTPATYDGVALSRREVMIAREAYENGLVRGTAREFTAGGVLREAVNRAYPLPMVERPRVVRDEFGISWRVAGGVLRYSDHHSGFCDASEAAGQWLFTKERVALWAELFANPNELVEEGVPE